MEAATGIASSFGDSISSSSIRGSLELGGGAVEEQSGGTVSGVSACRGGRWGGADNKFGGEIPEFFSGLKNLVRLNLANNNFSGEVPGSFRNLSRLKTLYLQENNLRGFMPELKLDLDQFNVSGNNLNGSIPVSLSSMPVTAFQGNRLCGKPLQICPGLAAVFVCGKKRNKESNAVDLASINKQLGFDIPEEEKPAGDIENGGYGGGGYSVPAVAAAALATPGHTKAEEVNGGGVTKKLVFFGNGIGGKMFDLEELLRASAEVLGKGTFGTAYKAVMEMGTVVAVKRLKDVILGEVEFKEKIEAVGAMEHENLVPLRAYYYSRDEKLLVFDYMPTGSLSAFLHGNKGAGRTPLNWELRSSIALGVARGITYLHSRGSDVSHGNIKSSNVLLTKSYEPRVSDFGLAQLVGPSSTPTRVNGYRAPEVTEPRKVSQKADVYSFGVLLLELLTGKAPTHALLNEEGVDLPRWVQSVVKDDWASEVFDLELLRYQHAEEEMVQLLQLAVDCAAQYPDTRPSMLEVTKRIEELCSPSIREVSDPATFINTDYGSPR
uniref:Protein kinase domain-containing protein n=1 Tax=Chenopodium quinoa TaxID=63459 RepID=A0A803LK76_CHEQI